MVSDMSMDFFGDTDPQANFDSERKYRYALRRGDMTNPIMFLMLNPSTADENIDDPTIRRCMGFSRSWGYSGLIVGNSFAYRSTDPRKLREVENPVGPENDEWISRLLKEANGNVVCAWGYNGFYLGRGGTVRQMIIRNGYQPMMLHMTNSGEPGHPLYLSSGMVPQPW